MSGTRRVLIGGGARSGKSSFAVSLAHRLGPRRVMLVTAQAFDDEMRERVARHRAERGAAFVTVEEPYDVTAAVRRLQDADVLVIDCVTLWLANLILRGDDASRILAAVDDLIAALAESRFHSVLVTNEVGMGVVPDSALGRTFRDVTGLAHQHLSRAASEIYFATLGVIVRLHPAPVEVQGLLS
jgi:adenosylcobinamide kinase/adenosylcobinamide-phosphate guanylyltransferase